MVGWNLRHLSKRAQTSAENHAIKIVQERLEQYLIGLKTKDFYIYKTNIDINEYNVPGKRIWFNINHLSYHMSTL